MEPRQRACPECRSDDYVFRGRRPITEEEKTVPVMKYKCRACGHEWKEKADEKAA
jgi:DNA-directed RNA polymerase subunit M/transcription elongation factor TFIIS